MALKLYTSNVDEHFGYVMYKQQYDHLTFENIIQEINFLFQMTSIV